MKITAVRAVQLSRRLNRPQRNACESRDRRTFTLVLVETDQGLTGLGEACGDQALMPQILQRRLGPMAVGLDPRDTDAVWRRLFAGRAFWETGGSVVCAGICAVRPKG
jgi:D-arabinonate dehydratase